VAPSTSVDLNALSVDLEEYFQVSNFNGIIVRDRWASLPSRVVDGTHRLLDTFDETESRATFFVLGWFAERQPALIREIADRGHEITCHGRVDLCGWAGRRRIARSASASGLSSISNLVL